MTDGLSARSCVDLLVQQVPELRPVYNEHLRDYDEALPHVFLGDVTRYVVRQLREGGPGRLDSVRRIVAVLEQCVANGDRQVQELVSVSFLENLIDCEDVITAVKAIIGPNLAKEFAAYDKG